MQFVSPCPLFLGEKKEDRVQFQTPNRQSTEDFTVVRILIDVAFITS